MGVPLWHSGLRMQRGRCWAPGTAVAQVQSLPQELPHAAGMAKKKNKFVSFVTAAKGHSHILRLNCPTFAFSNHRERPKGKCWSGHGCLNCTGGDSKESHTGATWPQAPGLHTRPA